MTALHTTMATSAPTLTTFTNSCASCNKVRPYMKTCPCEMFLYCSNTCRQQLVQEHKCSESDPTITIDMIQAAVAFVDQSDIPQPLSVLVSEDGDCSFASRDLASEKDTSSEQFHVLFKPATGPMIRRSLDWIAIDRHDLPLRVKFDFYQEQSNDIYFGDTVVSESVHMWTSISNTWEIPVPARGDMHVSVQVGDRIHEGQLAYSTRSILNPLPRTSIPGAILMDVRAQQGDLQRFSQLPTYKLLKLYAGVFVVHLQLKKVTIPEPIHQDKRHRTMIYRCDKVLVIPRTTAKIQDLPKQCLFCCEPARLKCGVCGVFYCSVECQKQDWKSHKRSHM